jgi:hypothetical protein
MTTSNTTHSHLPEVFSTTIPAFASKADYISFRDEWRLIYKHLSLQVQKSKCYLTDNMRPEKATYRTARGEKLNAQLKALPPSIWLQQYQKSHPYKGWQITPENTGNSRTEKRIVYGQAAFANWLLWLRRETKRVRREQRAQELRAVAV